MRLCPQHQGLVQSVLQPVMSLLGHAILVGFPGIDQRGLEPVVLQELGVVVVEGTATVRFISWVRASCCRSV